MLVTKKVNPMMPSRILVYGPEGVGKSTLGAKSDEPLFITPEGGADRLTRSDGLPVDYIPNVNDWDSIMGALISVRDSEHSFKTLVLDSADWIESVCHKKILGASSKSITTVGGGYGAGYREAQAMHVKLIELLSEIREKRGMNIIVTAHAHVRPVKDPEMLEDYDAYEIKCHEMVSSLWREWVDGLFFVRFKTYLNTSDDTQKARALTDGSRVIYTRKTPAFQAKNRYGMPAEMKFTENFWNEFQAFVKKGIVTPESAEKLFVECTDLIKKLPDSYEGKSGIIDYVESSKKDVAKLLGARNRLLELTK